MNKNLFLKYLNAIKICFFLFNFVSKFRYKNAIKIVCIFLSCCEIYIIFVVDLMNY